MDLSRHATILIPTENERVKRFIDGLTYTIRLQMAKEAGSDISFQTTVDISRWIELVRAQERGQVSGKRSRYSSSFSGASSGGIAYNAPSAPISAPQIQSYHCGYSARSGQLQFQQPHQQDGCFDCGGIGHIRRSCPRLLGGMPHQSSRTMVLTPVAPPLAQPARGRGQAV
ncbi:uncharacterized protein [Nicotiana tomentosiformis]|uniref:uncharacterized protein n=1 Tax=Nicotiana tomentosiformis TaxID=4098 RepID=UPI00388CAE6A